MESAISQSNPLITSVAHCHMTSTDKRGTVIYLTEHIGQVSILF